MNFASFSNALVQLSQGIEAGSQGNEMARRRTRRPTAETRPAEARSQGQADALRAKGARRSMANLSDEDKQLAFDLHYAACLHAVEELSDTLNSCTPLYG